VVIEHRQPAAGSSTHMECSRPRLRAGRHRLDKTRDSACVRHLRMVSPKHAPGCAHDWLPALAGANWLPLSRLVERGSDGSTNEKKRRASFATVDPAGRQSTLGWRKAKRKGIEG
jgi:hypothetical protein